MFTITFTTINSSTINSSMYSSTIIYNYNSTIIYNYNTSTSSIRPVVLVASYYLANHIYYDRVATMYKFHIILTLTY